MKRALIIEDDLDAIEVMTDTLGMYSFQCDSAINGQIGLSIFENHFYDLVLLDLNMPIKNGFQVLEIIRTSVHNPNVPIIVVSGILTDEGKERVESISGANYLLPKPINLNDLTGLVKSIFINKP